MTLILKEVLQEKGVSIARLVELLEKKKYKLSRVAISNMINGKASPKLSTLEEIADALDMHASELMEAKESDYKTIYEKDEEGNFIEVGMIKKL